MSVLIDPIKAATVLDKHANILIVGGIELKQALEYAALACQLVPAVEELSRAAFAFAAYYGAPLCPGPLEQQLRAAIERVKELTP